MKQLENGRKLDRYIPEGILIVLRIYGKIGKKSVGSIAFCSYPEKNGKVSYAEVLHIFVEKPYRRQGYARDLVKELQNTYNCIVTSWTGSESCGRDLFLDCGFKVKKAMFDRDHSSLEWTK